MQSTPKLPSAFLVAILLVLISPAAFTQWSDTQNKFTDSLHMPVCQEPLGQGNSIIVRSYPDSGWFVIWQDARNTSATRTDIYAQKYDKNGVALWSPGGIPVVNGPRDEHFTYSFNGNYRNYSVAATDSAGGFYITWIQDSISQYNWRRIYVQNILSNGDRLIPGDGKVIAYTPPGASYEYFAPQLIADGYKGFYVTFLRLDLGAQYVQGFNYKKEGNELVQNGGGMLNEYWRETQSIGPCGIINTTTAWGMTIGDYYIWPDGQGGCNVVMNMSMTGYGPTVGYNRLCRVKKDCTTTVYVRTTDIANCSELVTNYKAGDVVILHRYRQFSNTVACSVPGPPPVVYTQTSYYIENFGMGFRILDNGGYDYQYPKGVTLNTPGNINAELVAFTRRDYVNNTVTTSVTRAVSYAVEKYDSLPYELCTNLTNCYTAHRFQPEGKVLDRVNNIRDTILGNTGTYYYDFNIAGGGNNIYATALIYLGLTNERTVFLQNLRLVPAGADTFALQYNTPSKQGAIIGKEVSTGAQSNSISYDNPMVAMDQLGNAVFHIREYYRSVRVSPILNGYELSWGAMGKAMGSGLFGNGSYRPELQYLLLDPTNGTGLMSWEDERTPPITSTNVYMRHLDSLNVGGYLPPVKFVNTLGFGGAFGMPAVLYGTSKQYSVIEGYSTAVSGYTPMLEILDNYNLGVIEVNVYANTGPIRTHNGKPYLDRTFSIKVQNNPAGAAPINVRLYFSNAEFEKLKTADPSIATPGHLSVIKQASAVLAAPASYTPVSGEEVIVPTSWAAVPGGYYIEIQVSSFSHFFIFKNENALPVTWVNIYAQWQNNTQAKISWLVADQVNVDRYVVQHSKDGNSFADVCVVAGSDNTQYSCIVPGDNASKNYYRVMEVDHDGNKSYSKIVLLTGQASTDLLTLYPNPARKVLNVQTSFEMREMNIIDAYGRNMFRYRGQNRVTTIDVTKYSKGIYTLLMIDKSGAKHYRKFVVE